MDTGTKNQLAGAWKRMTGRTQMAAGAQFDDPDRFFNGVVDAMQGQLQQKIGADQANRVRDALRLRWEGTTQEAKGQILRQWGEWADDPVAMAQGHPGPSRSRAMTPLACSGLARVQPGGGASMAMPKRLSPAVVTAGATPRSAAIFRASSLAP